MRVCEPYIGANIRKYFGGKRKNVSPKRFHIVANKVECSVRYMNNYLILSQQQQQQKRCQHEKRIAVSMEFDLRINISHREKHHTRGTHARMYTLCSKGDEYYYYFLLHFSLLLLLLLLDESWKSMLETCQARVNLFT